MIGEDGQVAVMPANLGYEQAAPATEGAHYALSHMRRAKIGSGHNVLVYGATGAIGSAAVQLLKTLDARVTAVCATPHLELVRTLGADKVIDYTAGDFTRAGPLTPGVRTDGEPGPTSSVRIPALGTPRNACTFPTTPPTCREHP